MSVSKQKRLEGMLMKLAGSSTFTMPEKPQQGKKIIILE
jgi:hypothetical protein